MRASGCKCRWRGDALVAQCTLHEGHVDALHEWAARAKAAEAALRELVTLKDIKDECARRRQRRPHSVTRRFPQDLLDAEADYKRRKPAAWDRARALMART